MIVYKFGYGGSADSPDISPFVVKLETWLRMSDLPYETRIGNLGGCQRTCRVTSCELL